MSLSSNNKKLISVEEARKIILETLSPIDTESIPFTQALNRVLAEAVISPINVPPFANAAMDGYAIIAMDSQAASVEEPVTLEVVENIPAGKSPTEEILPRTAARIMTGAPMPLGANAVIRFENTSEYAEGVDLPENEVQLYQPVALGDNVRLAGEDIQQDEVVLQPGQRLRPQEIGVLAAMGQASVTTYRRPRVAILATGDELVDVQEPLAPGKIRNSNGYTQAAMVEKYGGEPIRLGIARDTKEDLRSKIREGLAQDVDLFLTSAGVSVGDFDIVKEVLDSEGSIQFWQVAMKPGKPLAFGLLSGDVPLIGLPGNPVAAMIAFEVFVRPALYKLGGLTSPYPHRILQATLENDVVNSGRRHYMRAFVRRGRSGGYRVTTRSSDVRVQGSGILSSMVWANCLVVISENVTHLPARAVVEVWLLD